MNPFHELSDAKPIDNLPSWAGAAVCYGRAYTWMSKYAYEQYMAAKPAPYVLNGRLHGYAQPEDITTMIKALNDGDEETIKGLNYQYRRFWQEGTTQ